MTVQEKSSSMKSSCFQSLTKSEAALLGISAALITGSFVLSGKNDYLTLSASLIGAASLVFNAKGAAFGQILMVLFSLLYGAISWSSACYGEMITYLGMTAPMALFAFVSWVKNPYEEGGGEVRIQRLSPKDWTILFLAAGLVTLLFYFILKALHTSCLPLGTLSVATSFIAVGLTCHRSPYFTLAYAANDLVLICLWSVEAAADPGAVSVVVCFCIFLVNDLYGWIRWSQRQKRQESGQTPG